MGRKDKQEGQQPPRAFKRPATHKPAIIDLGGDRYAVAVMKVEERSADGRVRKLSVVYDEDRAQLSKGAECLIVYANEKAIRTAPPVE